MAKLFGFSIENNDEKPKSIVSPVPPNNEDGVDYFIQSGFYGQYVDIEGVYRTEYDLIRRYREMALHPECDGAIESVVNEAIVSDLYDSPVEIELSNLNASDRLKQVIREEFKYIKEMMDFDKKCHEIFRNWYVDGRLFYLKVIDQKNPEAGIQELRYIDPMKMKHIRQEKKLPGNGTNGFRNLNLMSKSFSTDQEYNFPEIEEYFIYTPTPNFPTGTISGGSKKGVKIAKDTITYCTSGLVDRNKGTILSYLHKAIKSLNQLRMIEDSLVIYRLCLVGDTRVKTNNGYSYIKDIQVGDTVYSYDNRIDKLVETTVSNKWLTGTKQTFKVKSKHHSIVGTDTHPVLVYDNDTKEVKYVPIKDLQAKRHSLTYIKPEEINGIEIRDITVSDLFPEYIFKEATQTKKNFLYKLIHEKGVSRDSLDGLSHKVGHFDKKYIENVKELCTSIGIASGEFLFENGEWCIHIGEYELPKFEKIISVETAEIEDVYDIEVSHEKHNFVANGIVVHNSRAPERRIFYIDVGNLPKVKAEQYLKEVMSRYRNKLVYDASTGEVRDDRKFMSMLEDFWLPRREGGRGTEITTLPGGQNLGELSDIEYFQKKLYRSLGVPETRIAGGGDGFNLGRSSEILRDELMFSKFVGRLRKRFANLFNDILRTQLLLKNIVSPEDWDKMSDHIQYDFLYDNHFAELKEAELLTNRLTLATTIEPYIGKYYSTEYVRKKILRQTDSEIIEIDLQIEDEIAKGILPNPNAPVDENGNPLPPEQGQEVQQGAGGDVPMEPSIDTTSLEIPEPKGGKI